ncbi:MULTISPECIES: hypothetical protein [unclassified Haladaptatus]|uniref:hypothetical protein n=1 Tax=unclassified Haladaptatus TaxID=2622732 RepID=UPI0007B46E71|nr:MULTISPECIES: hypothetical protein [unclassified Haladaptatus]KZN25614.1 hypothetical protein A4G99_03860 [Haladaptatus sp. R4]MCO8243202.1 hypothetical protein [Haladaptatus sp. AB643]MCO8252914.1 hypothetical protein [Haladaptatus sp. AB618]
MNSIQLASGLAVVNILLLAVLVGVWVRSYLKFRTALVLGLLAFALVMLAENVVALYYFFGMQMFYSGNPAVQQAVLVLRTLQFVALVFLTWVTVK